MPIFTGFMLVFVFVAACTAYFGGVARERVVAISAAIFLGVATGEF